MESRIVALEDAQEQLSNLVQQVMQQGVHVVITVDGHPQVELVPHRGKLVDPVKPRPTPERVTLSEGSLSGEILEELRQDPH